MVILQANYSAGEYKSLDTHTYTYVFCIFSGVLSQALTSMAALGKLTSSERNKSSADVLDKHPDSFTQPEADEYQPRLVKRDGESSLRNNRTHYNPPRRSKTRPTSAKKPEPTNEPIPTNENQDKEDEQLALRLVGLNFVLNRIYCVYLESN